MQGGSAVCSVLVMLVLSGCNSAPSGEPDGVRVVAQEDVMISQTPLGEVGSGDLESGDEATATCFVRRAPAQVGAISSAIKVRVGDVTGYAAVTDFPEDPADQRQMFDLDAETLARRLPACPR